VPVLKCAAQSDDHPAQKDFDLGSQKLWAALVVESVDGDETKGMVTMV
jgi:hypothetical protein